MSSRRVSAPESTLLRAPAGSNLRVAHILRPTRFSDRVWRLSVLRLEELGVFPGQIVERVGSAGPGGAVIIKAGGSRVALSKELAEVVLVRGP